MPEEKHSERKTPLILRFHRLMDAFAKSDDERDFYLDKIEGFIIYADLDRNLEEFDLLQEELKQEERKKEEKRYLMIPKMTFYETKKFMEGFVNEKVYDIDTKEKLLDIISSKEPRENFLEFVYDHLTELEKWQQYYHERSRIRVIEWLRNQELQFVFEEDLDLPAAALEKVKRAFFEEKVPKDVLSARQTIQAKAKSYYSNEALNPRPKRGRPPKQVAKVEVEPQLAIDIYQTVSPAVRPFLYKPDYGSTVTFSARFDTEAQLIASLRGSSRVKIDSKLEALSQRLESLRHLSDRLKMAKGIGLEGEERLIQAVSKRELEFTPTTANEKPKRVVEIAQGVMPGKKEEGVSGKEGLQQRIQKRQAAGIKQVSVIKKKDPSKKKS